jgi:hypothetical protein
LVAGRNRLEAHKRSGREVIIARVITGETPETARAVQLIEIDENLNRRELSPALRRSLTRQRKALYEEEHPKAKRGSAGGRAKASKGALSRKMRVSRRGPSSTFMRNRPAGTAPPTAEPHRRREPDVL